MTKVINDIEKQQPTVQVQVQPNEGFFSKKLKTLVVLGSVAAVGIIGYAYGFSQGEGKALDSVEMAKKTLVEAFSENKKNLSLTPLKLNKILDENDERFFSGKVMESLKVLRADFQSQQQQQNYRALTVEILGENNNKIATEAWSKVDNADYSHAIKDGDDFILVERDPSKNSCYVIAQQSGSLDDWLNNLDLGDEDILSMNKYNQRDESCGCEQKTWWWCSRYKSCPVYKKIGVGYDGFVKCYNRQRVNVKNQILSKCASTDTIVLTGYSRGAGIISPIAFALMEEGIIPKSRMRMVTFGSPRALDDATSDKLHNQFFQLRLVYEKDPVPSLPYGWMGFKHFGTLYCNNCDYDTSRDAPGFSWVIDGVEDHLSASYGTWFSSS